MTSATAVRHIDEKRLENDLGYRFGYLSEFIGFGADDVAAVRSAGTHLLPSVPGWVDAVYEKLFRYDATKRHFVPRQSGYAGALPTTMDELTPEHEQIRFRKQHLGGYLRRLLTGEYDAKMVAYLDAVGKMHTEKSGSPTLVVPLVQMGALLAFVSDVLLSAVLALPLPDDEKARAARAFNKLLWLQNDLIARHYVG